MIMHQGIDKVQSLSLIWWIKFYNGEGKAHSLVRSLKYFALVWSLALEPIPLGTAARVFRLKAATH